MSIVNLPIILFSASQVGERDNSYHKENVRSDLLSLNGNILDWQLV
jgi:hypothetical protein